MYGINLGQNMVISLQWIDHFPYFPGNYKRDDDNSIRYNLFLSSLTGLLSCV